MFKILTDSMRTGDKVFAVNNGVYEVEKILGGQCAARRVKSPKRLKTFLEARLVCVDQNDGIWQEII